jgi:predicted tellurium resistance membrane protein TerC
MEKMLEWVSDPAIWASLLTLTAMEIVLGVDNIVFISVLVSRLPKAQADAARRIGLLMALAFRIVLLLALVWLIGLTMPVFSAFGQDFSWRDLILIAGGLFLFYKATHEIHAEIESHDGEHGGAVIASLTSVVAQIVVIDAVFSIDSIVTAIGMAEHVEIMIAAVVIAITVMYFSSAPIADFIARHPTTKMLALSFLFLIGVTLVADGIGFHIPKGYVYFSMAFATGVEAVNILVARRRRKPEPKA